MFKSLSKFGLPSAVALFLAGCASDALSPIALSGVDPAEGRLAEKLATNDLPKGSGNLQKAQLQFAEGNYGKAAKYYRSAAEEDAKDPNVWLGLAASYDNIRRFDLADKAYRQVRRLVGRTPTVRNNLGYSYMLRGKLKASQRELLAAYSAAPDNPYIRNNIEALNKKLAKLGRPTINVNG